MTFKPDNSDYEPLTKAKSSNLRSPTEAAREDGFELRRPESKVAQENSFPVKTQSEMDPGVVRSFNQNRLPLTQLEEGQTFKEPPETEPRKVNANVPAEPLILKHGHAVSFAGFFLFTFVLYFRPYELFPSLAGLSSTAFWIAIATLVVFIPAQLGLENRISIRPPPVNFALLLMLAALFSVPLANEPFRAWYACLDFAKVIAMFIVMVNVVRTETRLRLLIWLIVIASAVFSFAAINDYRLGKLAMRGVRIEGVIGGMFSNPNDLALHLVMMVPIAIGFSFASRGLLKKLVLFFAALLFIGGIVVTFSRGGFLGLFFAVAFGAWKLAPRNRVLVMSFLAAVALALMVTVPSTYRSRISTTEDDSAVARVDDLKRSVFVAVRHPLLGVGMENYILYSNANKATHNAYTQVAADLGLPALLIYVMLLVTTFKSLNEIQRATAIQKSHYFYLSVGLQASLIGYMVASFFASVAYLWYVYYLVGYCICLGRLHAIASENLSEQAREGATALTARTTC